MRAPASLHPCWVGEERIDWESVLRENAQTDYNCTYVSSRPLHKVGKDWFVLLLGYSQRLFVVTMAPIRS